MADEMPSPSTFGVYTRGLAAGCHIGANDALKDMLQPASPWSLKCACLIPARIKRAWRLCNSLLHQISSDTHLGNERCHKHPSLRRLSLHDCLQPAVPMFPKTEHDVMMSVEVCNCLPSTAGGQHFQFVTKFRPFLGVHLMQASRCTRVRREGNGTQCWNATHPKCLALQNFHHANYFVCGILRSLSQALFHNLCIPHIKQARRHISLCASLCAGSPWNSHHWPRSCANKLHGRFRIVSVLLLKLPRSFHVPGDGRLG